MCYRAPRRPIRTPEYKLIQSGRRHPVLAPTREIRDPDHQLQDRTEAEHQALLGGGRLSGHVRHKLHSERSQEGK